MLPNRRRLGGGAGGGRGREGGEGEGGDHLDSSCSVKRQVKKTRDIFLLKIIISTVGPIAQ